LENTRKISNQVFEKRKKKGPGFIPIGPDPNDNSTEPSWLNRLPQIASVNRTTGREMREESEDEGQTIDEIPPPYVLIPSQFHRRQEEKDPEQRLLNFTNTGQPAYLPHR
jgi:hypothetical protein